MRAVLLFVLLMVFWVVLSGYFDVRKSGDAYLVGSGIVSCLFITWLSRRHRLLDEESFPLQIALRALAYLPWIFWQILLSNWDVIKRVWNPRRPISPVVVTVPYRMKKDLTAVIYANSITLTPGTVTMEVDPEKREMLIHCLTEEAAKDLQAGAMHDRVLAFEKEPESK